MDSTVSVPGVLIVDDSSPVREAVRWALEASPDLFVVGEAGTGKDALCRAREVGPDIVLLDIELPDQDGYAVARVLKQTPRPPVIVFLTLHGDPATRRRASEAGGDAFVEKGICCATLVDRLRAAFAARPQLPQGPLPDP